VYTVAQLCEDGLKGTTVAVLDVEVDDVSERTHVHVLDHLVKISFLIETPVEFDHIGTVTIYETLQILNELVTTLFLIYWDLFDCHMDVLVVEVIASEPDLAC
jgi:hypothetical protein